MVEGGGVGEGIEEGGEGDLQRRDSGKGRLRRERGKRKWRKRYIDSSISVFCM